jgi:hypothetical protein
VREIFFDWLREHRPDLLERYERLYARGAYLPVDERRTIERAAGAPWARKSYPDRFRHRTAGEQRRIDAARRAGGGGRRAAGGGGQSPPDGARERPQDPAQQSLF